MAKKTTNKSFQFKQFIINQDKVSMKVGTDGVLVGAWADITGKKKILDIGTGTGLIALILAQRSQGQAMVHAIDVDENSINQAKSNFENSPWFECFSLHHDSIQSFSTTYESKYDLIISNPPFFTGSLVSNDVTRADARHTIKLPHGDLLQSVDRLLSNDGSLVLILPYLQGLRFMEICTTYRLFPSYVTEVITKPGKPIERVLIQFERKKQILKTDQLLIQEENNEFSSQYISITKDFYLNF